MQMLQPEVQKIQDKYAGRDDENSKIDDKMIGWLMSSSEIKDESEEISDEDFAKIDMEPIGEFGQWNYVVRGFKA